MFSDIWTCFRQVIKNLSVCFPNFWGPGTGCLLVWEVPSGVTRAHREQLKSGVLLGTRTYLINQGVHTNVTEALREQRTCHHTRTLRERKGCSNELFSDGLPSNLEQSKLNGMVNAGLFSLKY